MKIVHATQASAAGVLRAVEVLVASQMNHDPEHIDVSVWYLRRPETDDHSTLSSNFPSGAAVEDISTNESIVLQLLRLTLRSVSFLRLNPDAVIHAHSSLAGAACRIAGLIAMAPRRVFYSPHGYSFSDPGMSSWRKGILQTAECLLARIPSSQILVSGSEHATARSTLRSRHASLVENAVVLSELSRARSNTSPGLQRKAVQVATVGRIARQKAPDRFVALSAALKVMTDRDVRCTWIGGMPDAFDAPQVLPASVECSGWLSKQEVHQALQETDIFVLASLWEGMPLALIEAQCMGIPAVVSDVAGNRDVVRDGETGFVVRNQRELNERVLQLVEDPSLRARLGRGAWDARGRFDAARIGPETLKIYDSAASGA